MNTKPLKFNDGIMIFDAKSPWLAITGSESVSTVQLLKRKNYEQFYFFPDEMSIVPENLD